MPLWGTEISFIGERLNIILFIFFLLFFINFIFLFLPFILINSFCEHSIFQIIVFMFSNLIGQRRRFFFFSYFIFFDITISLSRFLICILFFLEVFACFFFMMFCTRNLSSAFSFSVAVLEVLSFFIRPLTLVIRLMGNILAGHVVRELMFESSEASSIFLCTYEGIVRIIQAFIFFKLLENYLEESIKRF